ncbi:MAG: 50S ribosomal protein L22 [Pseudomonadota bacterium]
MSKAKRERQLAENEARAVTKNLRVSPQKLNLVAGMIRGQKAEKAVADLTFSQKRISNDVLKTLQSAISNAENNHSLDVDALVVAEAYVGTSFALKRFHARGRGKAASVSRPFAHLTIIVRQVEKEEPKPRKVRDKADGATKTKTETKTTKKKAA